MSFKSATYNNHRSLLDAVGERIAHLLNTGGDDLIGAWRWRVWLGHRMQQSGSKTGAEARETCERQLAEYQQAQKAQWSD